VTTTLAPIATVTPELGWRVLGFERWRAWREEYEWIAGKSFIKR